jgi:hypothetical protein
MKTHRRPLKGEIYAVHTGDYAGEMLIFIEEKTKNFRFLSVPIMENRIVPVESFNFARNTDIIKYVERAPEYVLQASIIQYKHNEKSNYRRM